MFRIPRVALLLVALSMVAVSCGDTAEETGSGQAGGDGLPTVVVTTNILGDVVTELTGGAVDVITVMPVGADPHDFQASAQQVAQMVAADALIVNGEGFEEGLLEVIETAEADGVPVYAAISTVSPVEFGEGGHDHDDHDDHDDHEGEEGHDDHDDHEGEEGHDDHEGEEGHDDHEGEEGHDDHDDHEGEEGHDDHEGHDHSGTDPHFFTDPARMAVAVDGIASFLIANVDGLDADTVSAAAAAYHQELEALDDEVAELIASIPLANRVLVTNHEVFGYFADRYGFEVAGTVIPAGSTVDGSSAGALAELAALIEAEGVPAIFSDVSASDQLAQALAEEVGDIAVVELFTESLGDADSEGSTYIDMIRTNAERIAGALAS